jgi:hypothetical protein
MKNPCWHDSVELVGILAIVASLVFVGLQLKQGQEIALANQYQNRAQGAQDYYLSLTEAGVAITDIRPGRSIEEMTPIERTAVINSIYWAWIAYDNLYFQREFGFLDDEGWAGQQFQIRELYDVCGARPIWQDMRHKLRASFAQWVESLPDNFTESQS